MTAFSFSYAPKASSALASINPIQSRGEGLRFAANTPMSFIKQNPEIVTEGFWKGRQALTEGIVKGVTSALSGVSGALTSKAAEAKADTKLKEDRAHEIAVANIKAAPTAAETAYQQQRSDLLKEQIDAAKAKNKEDSADDGFNAIPSGIIDWSSYNRKKDFKTPVNEVPSAPATTPNPASSSAPPVVPNAPVAPAGVSQFAPADAGRELFQFDQGTGTDAFGNMPPRQSSMEFNLTPPPQTQEMAATAPTTEPVVTQVAPESVFGQSTNGIVPLRDTLKKTEAISGTAPAPVPSSTPVLSELKLPERAGEMTLGGDTFELMPISGAEGVPVPKTPAKPLEGTTPPPVESELPTQQPSESVLAQAVPETEAEYRYRLESDLTGQPFMNPADARMAKNILEQQLGVKAKVNGIDAGKGKRIYRVEIIEDALSPMEGVPKDMVVKSVTQKDGTETRVLIPKMPAEQQVKSVDVAIDRAKTLQTAINKIRGIAGGISPGTGKFSNLMNKLPIQTDASTVRALNNTIKGIIGFQELVDLKAQGGTLGALSDAELNMLTSLQGSLDVDNLNSDTYLEMLKDIETKTKDVQKKMEAYKKELMTTEKPTKFQPIKSETPKYQKGQVAIINGNSYKWDGNQWNLIQ
jgi:hypothetical protein